MNKIKLIQLGFWLLPWMPSSYLVAGIVAFRAFPGHHPEPTVHFDDRGHSVSINSHESEVYLHLVGLLPLIIFVATIVFIVGLVLLVASLFLRARMAQTPELDV